jgi:hypothetical protein
MQPKAQMSRTATTSSAPEDLPYCIELWRVDGPEDVESVLARALSAELARAIFKAAQVEHPGRRITLRRGDRIISDSAERSVPDLS